MVVRGKSELKLTSQLIISWKNALWPLVLPSCIQPSSVSHVLFIVVPIFVGGFCVRYLFCCAVLCVLSKFAIIPTGNFTFFVF